MELETYFSRLSLSAQTAFSHLNEVAMRAELDRTIANLSGSFVMRKTSNHNYWYFKHTDAHGKQRQIYVGPDTPEVQSMVEQKKDSRQADNLKRLAKTAFVSGCQTTPTAHFRIIKRLSDYGFYKSGGVTIGSHAFIAYANMLGVRWGAAAAATMDIDFAHAGNKLSIALPADIEVDTSAAINSLKMGFVPLLGGAGGGAGTWYLPDEQEFMLDFVTPQTTDEGKPFHHPQLGITLQPLRYMEYSLEDVQQTTIFDNSSAVVINVPHPARYALHKLIVYGLREGHNRSKSNKDLQQSALLLKVLRDQHPDEVQEAWEDLQVRGPKWRKNVQNGLDALSNLCPKEGFEEWLNGMSA